MTRPLSAIAGASNRSRVAVPVPGVINLFNPVRSDQQANVLYDANGALTPLGAFAVPGLIPITAEMRAQGFCWSISGAPKNWLGEGTAVVYYNGTPAGTPTFVQRVTAGVTVSADTRTLIQAPANIPATATHAGISVKWGDGPNNSWASSNVIPAGALDDLLPHVMVNVGLVPACLTDYGTGTVLTDTADPDLEPGEILTCKNGLSFFHRSVIDATWHEVSRDVADLPSRNGNAGYQYRSIARIPAATPASATPGAFAAVNTDTATDANMITIESDNEPAYRSFGGFFEDGQHSAICWVYAITAHGKTLEDVGDEYSIGGKVMILADVPNANSIVFLAPLSGTQTDWLLDTANPGTGALTRVSGAGPHGGNLTAGTTPVQSQFWPAVQDDGRQFLMASGFILANGVYRDSLYRTQIDSRFPNLFDAYAAIKARTRDMTPFRFNATGIQSQIRTHREIIRDGWQCKTVVYENEALLDHYRAARWPAQWQPLTRRPGSGETLWQMVPGTLPVLSGPAAPTGNVLDFGSGWLNVTSDTTNEFIWTATHWRPASWWSDNVQRPPRLVAMQVRSSGGMALRTLMTANSAIMGRTAENDYTTTTPYISAPKKAYMADDYDRDVVQGEVSTSVNGTAIVAAMIDPEALIHHIFPLPDGTHEMIWYRLTGALTGHVILPRADLVGRTYVPVNQGGDAATVTVDGDEITVTSTGELYLTFHIQ